MNKLTCNVVLDLLPSFADNLVNEQTAAEINSHLAECEKCSAIYNEMVNGEDSEIHEAEKEINYLKMIKKRNRKIIGSILAAVLITIIILFGVYSFYGILDEAYSVSNISVTDNIMNAEINLYSSANRITKAFAEEKDGIVTIEVRSSLFALNKNSSTTLSFMANEYIDKIQTSDGRVIWEYGEAISQKINDIYNAKVKYIGDNSAVSNLLCAINIKDALKCESYSIHLLTDKEPYGLEIYDINSYDEMFSAFTNEGYEQKMKSCAFIILACIENADYVKFNYIAPDKTEKTYTLTVKDAENYLGIVNENNSLKDWSENHWSLKMLIDTVEEYLITTSYYEYEPLMEVSKEIVDKLNNNPIDKKYLDIQNNSTYFTVNDENENYIKWAEAYKKQYTVIYNALLDYAKSDPEVEDNVRKSLIEAIESVEDFSKHSDIVADLYYITEQSKMGMGSMRESTYCRIYLNEARINTLRLAEIAYFLDVDFDWVE